MNEPIAAKINQPRIHFYDRDLVMRAEAAKFRQPDFSDTHWATLLLIDYKASSYTEETYGKDKAAGRVNPWRMRTSSALELVLRCYVNQGPTAARKLASALEAEGEQLPSWMKLPTTSEWLQQVQGPPPRFRFDAFGFICGEDTRPLDGD